MSLKKTTTEIPDYRVMETAFTRIEAWNIEAKIGFIWFEGKKILVLKGMMSAPSSRGDDLTGQWLEFRPDLIVKGGPGPKGQPQYVLTEVDPALPPKVKVKSTVVHNPNQIASLELSYTKPPIKLYPPLSRRPK